MFGWIGRISLIKVVVGSGSGGDWRGKGVLECVCSVYNSLEGVLWIRHLACTHRCGLGQNVYSV